MIRQYELVEKVKSHEACTECGRDMGGFTLIELSIVLVIIGLIVGGILTGRDLIRTAELRADINAVEKFDAAVNTFNAKYNCIPGDCKNASAFFTTANPENGNGDGLISDGYAQPSSEGFVGYEYAYAIDHLARAHLIAAKPFEAAVESGLNMDTVTPTLPSGGHFMVRDEIITPDNGNTFSETGKHTYRLGIHDSQGDCNLSSVFTDNPIYTPTDAFYIDSKLDDGKATSGRVTAGMNDDCNNAVSAFAPISILYLNGVCSPDGLGRYHGLNPATCDYDFTIKDPAVGIFIRASF